MIDNEPAPHPALNRTWWVNLYADGGCTGALCKTRESALNRCTYTGDTPDAIQVEVRIVPVQSDGKLRHGTNDQNA